MAQPWKFPVMCAFSSVFRFQQTLFAQASERWFDWRDRDCRLGDAFGLPMGGLICAGLLLVSATETLAGPAIGQFELKDLEAEPGRVEFQSQNAHTFNNPSREFVDEGGGDIEFDDNSVSRQRHGLELEAAFSRYLRLRVGIEFEKERIEEPASLGEANAFEDLRLDEVAVEAVVIAVPVPEGGGFGFGFLAEFESPVFADELKTIFFGPIIEYRAGPIGYVSNILFVHAFGSGEDGEDPDRKWDLAYAQQLSYQFNETWILALEAYGTFDRLGNSGSPGEERELFGDHDQHRLGPIVYYEFDVAGGGSLGGGPASVALDDAEDADGVEVSIGTGVLFGLNDNTPDATLKWSVEVEF